MAWADTPLSPSLRLHQPVYLLSPSAHSSLHSKPFHSSRVQNIPGQSVNSGRFDHYRIVPQEANSVFSEIILRWSGTCINNVILVCSLCTMVVPTAFQPCGPETKPYLIAGIVIAFSLLCLPIFRRPAKGVRVCFHRPRVLTAYKIFCSSSTRSQLWDHPGSSFQSTIRLSSSSGALHFSKKQIGGLGQRVSSRCSFSAGGTSSFYHLNTSPTYVGVETRIYRCTTPRTMYVHCILSANPVLRLWRSVRSLPLIRQLVLRLLTKTISTTKCSSAC